MEKSSSFAKLIASRLRSKEDTVLSVNKRVEQSVILDSLEKLSLEDLIERLNNKGYQVSLCQVDTPLDWMCSLLEIKTRQVRGFSKKNRTPREAVINAEQDLARPRYVPTTEIFLTKKKVSINDL